MNIYRNTIYIITLITILISSINIYIDGEEIASYPIAIGFSGDNRYILYSNNTIYRILSNGSLEPITQLSISIDISNYTIRDFTIVDNYIAFYLYRAINISSGYTRILVLDIGSGELLYDKIFRFNVVNRTSVYGDLITIAAMVSRGIAIVLSNSTSTYIFVYERTDSGFTLSRIYNTTYSYTLYIYNNTILGVVPYTGFYYNRTILIPNLVDIFTNRSLFEIPSLIPVIPFATPLVQVFMNKTNWLIHITVINRLANRIEYYLTEPNSLKLRDFLRASFSPTMDCGVLETVNGSIVMFNDGTMYFLNKYIPIIPREIYMSIDPQNGVIDIDRETHRVLLKYSAGNKTSIYVLQNNELTKVYELPIEYSYKASGFYAAIKNSYVFIIDPEKRKLIKIDLENIQSVKGYSSIIYIALILSIISIAVVLIIKLKYRYPLHLKQRYRK